eukprot:scaffold126551_cov43-Attheya_sp.AAC.1
MVVYTSVPLFGKNIVWIYYLNHGSNVIHHGCIRDLSRLSYLAHYLYDTDLDILPCYVTSIDVCIGGTPRDVSDRTWRTTRRI